MKVPWVTALPLTAAERASARAADRRRIERSIQLERWATKLGIPKEAMKGPMKALINRMIGERDDAA
jgi:hypothetical protein